MLKEDTKKKLFEFLKDCEDKNLTLVETLFILRYSGAIPLTEALDYIAEYKQQKEKL